jgi:hypothetical protein
MVGLAIVLARLGDTKALFHVALGMDREDGRGDRGGEGGGNGDTGGCHAMLHEMLRFLYKRIAQLAFTRRLSFP